MISQKQYLEDMLEVEKLFFIEEEDSTTEKRDKDYENKKKKIKQNLSFDTVKAIKKNDRELDDIVDVMRNYKISNNQNIDNNKELFKKHKKNRKREV